MIRNIIFDMGNVMIGFNPSFFIDRLGIGGEDKTVLMRNVYQSIEWASLDHGTLTEEQALSKIRERLPERLHDVARTLVTMWDRPIIEIPGMYELAKELKENGYHLYLLTNASARQHEYWPRSRASSLMEGTMVSADEKLIKPMPEIYDRLCERFALKAEECVFIDDSVSNAEAAVFCGMHGIVFHGDAEEVREQLNEFGVKISRKS